MANRSDTCSAAVTQPGRHLMWRLCPPFAKCSCSSNGRFPWSGNIVTEGRDQGSVVFPDAELKVYLDAAPQGTRPPPRAFACSVRARGEIVDYNEVLNGIVSRDQRDATRSVGPLAIPPGARVIDTTNLSEPQVVDLIVSDARPR